MPGSGRYRDLHRCPGPSCWPDVLRGSGPLPDDRPVRLLAAVPGVNAQLMMVEMRGVFQDVAEGIAVSLANVDRARLKGTANPPREHPFKRCHSTTGQVDQDVRVLLDVAAAFVRPDGDQRQTATAEPMAGAFLYLRPAPPRINVAVNLSEMDRDEVVERMPDVGCEAMGRF